MNTMNQDEPIPGSAEARALRLARRARERELLREEEARRAEFAAAFGAKRIKWSGQNLSRLLRATGERPERVELARKLLDGAGLKRFGGSYWPQPYGAFDHGEMWSRDGKPWAIVGHPYQLNAEEQAAL